MIKRWHLKNFKSFRNLPPLELSQINILAGANSSGKSSIIQSILLLKQTLQYGSEGRSITLNGPLLRLGEFDDIRNFEADGDDVKIGLDYEFGDGDRISPWARNRRRGTEAGILRSLTLQLSYRQRAETPYLSQKHFVGPKRLTADLSESTVTTSRVIGNDAIKDAFASFKKPLSEPRDEDESARIRFDYSVELDNESIREIAAGKPQVTIGNGILSYFLPSWIMVQYNLASQRAMHLAERICNLSTGLLSYENLSEETVSQSIVKIANVWLENHNADPIIDSKPKVLALEIRNRLLPFLNRGAPTLGGLLAADNKIAADLAQLREQILQVMLQECGTEYDVELETPRSIREASEFLKDFFKRGIRYLGPLRDSPRPVYQVEALESTTDVGYRGEHTAAVLDLNSAKRVSYHRPPSEELEADYVTLSRSRTAPLHDAVVEWMSYLGVAEEVATTDAGVFGNRLQVSTDSTGRMHDLTNVGVGVSQVLPIVVTALLAPESSFLIFEQPELHLHPKVQARLADFFLSLALDGKQTLLETHSEYLVDRFRLRIALSASDSVRPLINILFSEKRGGQSSLRPVEISEFGSIINWPEDFFEQSQRDTGRIIRAASEKRRSRPRGQRG
ncbi:MAG: DUF3696 domain-containing protein [Methylocella sp.]